MHKNILKAIRSIWRFALTVVDVILVGGSDKNMTPCYAPMKAKHRYEEGQSSASQYRRSLGRD